MSRILNRGNCPPSDQLLQELCNQYVLSAPEEKRKPFETLLFLVESAHWCYLDNFVAKDPTLKKMGLREFTMLLFNCCDELRPDVGSVDTMLKVFNSHKHTIPVAGAIILDNTNERFLLVRGYSGRWSFPRGKKNENEEDHKCAIREVLEETGCDISYQLNKKEYLELKIKEQRIRLYIVAGVGEDRPFAPLTNEEISAITWHPIDHIGRFQTFMVEPFISLLKEWIVDHPSLLARNTGVRLKELCVWSSRLGGKRTITEESCTRALEIKFGSLTCDQYRAVGKRLVVMKSNNTKPEVETTTSESSSRETEEVTTITLESRNTKSEPKTITIGSLTIDLSTI